MGEYDPSVFIAPPVAGSTAGSTTLVPQVTTQQTTANLAAGAVVDFDFNVDANPLFDLFVFADQVLDVYIYIRSSVLDTYRLLDNAIYASGVANVLKRLIAGLRIPGSQVRIEVRNNSGVATTAVSMQCHSRSI